MKFKYNPYYYPEKCNLKIFYEFDKGLDYEFDKLVILESDKGLLFWDTDSGCSCPTPFDPAENRHNLKLVSYNSFRVLEKELRNFINNAAEVSLIINKVKNFLKTNNMKP